MTKKSKTKTDKKGREETWEWEETPEVIEAVKKLHEEIQSNLETNAAPDYGVGK